MPALNLHNSSFVHNSYALVFLKLEPLLFFPFHLLGYKKDFFPVGPR